MTQPLNTSVTDLVSLQVPTPATRDGEAASAVALAQSFDVNSVETCQFASEMYAETKGTFNELDAERMEMKRPVLEAGRRIDNHFRKALTDLDMAAGIWNRKVSAFLTEQKNKRLALEAKAREEARKEQERLAREAAEREVKAQQEAAQLRAESLALAQQGNQTAAAELASRADQAEMAGQQDAHQILEQVQQTLPIMLDAGPVLTGVTPRNAWEPEYVDLMETVKAVAEGKAPLKVLQWNEDTVRRMVIALQDTFSVPGIAVKQTATVAVKPKTGRK
jgi:hypothetical protein